MSNLCHLDNLLGSHSNFQSLYKKLQRAQCRGKDVLRGMPGNREVRRPEPAKEVAHQDFLLKEMQDMAQDFREEAYYKRYMLTKLAYEAQAKALVLIDQRAKKDLGAKTKVITGPTSNDQNPKPFERQEED